MTFALCAVPLGCQGRSMCRGLPQILHGQGGEIGGGGGYMQNMRLSNIVEV